MSPYALSIKHIALYGLLLLFSCRPNPYKNMPLGTQAASDSLFASSYFEGGHITEGFVYVDSIFHSLKNPTAFDHVYYYNIHSWGKADDLYKGIRYADSAINLVKALHAEKEMLPVLLFSYTTKGQITLGLKEYAKATDILYEAKAVAAKYSDSCSNRDFLYQLAMMLYKQQEYQLAADYFKEVYAYNETCRVEEAYRHYKAQELQDNIGLCYTRLYKYDSALYHYHTAMDILDAHKDQLAIESTNSISRYNSAKAVVLGNMAKVFTARNQLDSAIDIYRQSLVWHERSKAEIQDAQLCKLQLADIYYRTHQLPNMQQLLEQVGNAMQFVADISIKMEYARLMHQYYEATHESYKELAYFKKYVQLRDSLAADENRFSKTNVLEEMNNRQRKFEVQLLQKDNQLNRFYIWLFALLAILALGIGALVYYLFKKSKKNVQQLTMFNNTIAQQKKDLELILHQLELSNAEKEKILHVVAHDLRSPVSGIAAITDTLLQDTNYTDEQQEMLHLVGNASNSTLTLINELLNEKANHAESLQRGWININDLVRQTASLLQFRAKEKKQAIVTQLDPAVPDLYLDADKMERAINNLVSNAIKFSPHGSNITVSTILEKQALLIMVKDRGIGIPKAIQESIFNMFTHAARKGTEGETSYGLGLSICKQIVEQHGGSIGFESKEGQGTTFTIRIPVV